MALKRKKKIGLEKFHGIFLVIFTHCITVLKKVEKLDVNRFSASGFVIYVKE